MGSLSVKTRMYRRFCAHAATARLTSSLASAPVSHKAVVGNPMPLTWIWTLVVNNEDPLLPTLANVNIKTIGEAFDSLTCFPSLLQKRSRLCYLCRHSSWPLQR
jgi:hypothetical protein